MAGAPVGAVPHTAYAPNVIGPQQGITQTRMYRAEVRLPQPNLPGASGRATQPNIRYSLGAGGVLEQVDTSAGVRRFVVNLFSRPSEV